MSAAKEAIITYLKQKVKSLQQTLAERKHCTCAPEPVDLENVPLQTSNRCNGIDATVIMVPGMMGETNVDATARKRKADDVELQTPQCKVAKTTSQSFLKAASDEMKSCECFLARYTGSKHLCIACMNVSTATASLHTATEVCWCKLIGKAYAEALHCPWL